MGASVGTGYANPLYWGRTSESRDAGMLLHLRLNLNSWIPIPGRDPSWNGPTERAQRGHTDPQMRGPIAKGKNRPRVYLRQQQFLP